MTGTDALIPTNIPGFSIHDELLELVEIGLTPYEALKASTTHPMEYLGELDDAGTIDIGKRADLVLLEANPLEDIRDTRQIAGVMVGSCQGLPGWIDIQKVQAGDKAFTRQRCVSVIGTRFVCFFLFFSILWVSVTRIVHQMGTTVTSPLYPGLIHIICLQHPIGRML